MPMNHIEIACLFQCPVCMSQNTVLLNRAEGEQQEFILDCEVCCASVQVRAVLTEKGTSQVEAEPA